MIEYVKGEVTELTPAYAVIEAHGVGYGLNISLIARTRMCSSDLPRNRKGRCSCCSSR